MGDFQFLSFLLGCREQEVALLGRRSCAWMCSVFSVCTVFFLGRLATYRAATVQSVNHWKATRITATARMCSANSRKISLLCELSIDYTHCIILYINNARAFSSAEALRFFFRMGRIRLRVQAHWYVKGDHSLCACTHLMQRLSITNVSILCERERCPRASGLGEFIS